MAAVARERQSDCGIFDQYSRRLMAIWQRKHADNREALPTSQRGHRFTSRSAFNSASYFRTCGIADAPCGFDRSRSCFSLLGCASMGASRTSLPSHSGQNTRWLACIGRLTCSGHFAFSFALYSVASRRCGNGFSVPRDFRCRPLCAKQGIETPNVSSFVTKTNLVLRSCNSTVFRITSASSI